VSRRAQSLVEFALIAPVLILLAMAAWDGGSVLREQVVLQQAARDGARVAATSYKPGASLATVEDAVLASASDLPALRNTPGFLSLSFPDAQSVQVQLHYSHALITPVLRQLWGGGSGMLTLSASATFYLPQQTPVPATIVPSTPLPTATPTPTPSPTSTPTPAATATPTVTKTPAATATPSLLPCERAITVPPLNNNTGYYVTLQLTQSSVITTTWTTAEEAGGQLDLFIYADSPFNDQPNPTSFVPSASPLAAATGRPTVSTSVSTSAGSYAVYFYKEGVGLGLSSAATISYQSATCS
jgi:Flp pilus assembly protein TadG